MNIYTKKFKKLILALVVLMLFSFCFPKNVNAIIGLDDLEALPLRIFWGVEQGVLTFFNNIFTNERNRTTETIVDGTYHAKKLTIFLTPENIIKGKFLIFDADIFKEITNDKDYYDYSDGDDKIGTAVTQGKKEIREIVSGWYYALKNFAIVALLSVLAYVAIRMIISTVAQDKAKYKTMFKDWLVALCLLMVMHYIMIGTLRITSLITDAIGGNGNNIDMVGTFSERISGMLSEEYDEAGSLNYSYKYVDSDTNTTYTLADGYAYALVILGVILYTGIFAIKYLKREFTIIFLILLGPISCVTYPIDKISDGKAQAFNKWLTEFIYQVLVQPFHLLIYVVLVGSAAQIAEVNVVYAIVCFAIMMPAEKFVKEMFGFRDKLGSPLKSLAAAGLAGKALKALTGKEKNGEDDNTSTPSQLPPKTVEDKSDLVDGASGSEESAEPRTTDLPEGEEDEEGTGEPRTTDLPEGEEDEEGTGAPRTTDLPEDGENDDNQKTNENRSKAAENKKGDLSQKKSEAKKSWGDKANSIHNQRMAKKYGTTNKKKRWVKRAGRGAKAFVKAATIGTLGSAAVAGMLLTGNGKEALATAGLLGGYLGKKTIKGFSGAIKTGKDYMNAFRKDTGEKEWYEFWKLNSKEAIAFKKFEADSKEIDKAVMSYRENHDGQDPTAEELEKEMRDRFDLSRYGLSSDQIDDAVGSYQELYENGLDNEEALKKTVYAAKLANDYSKKDFRSEKTMKEAVDTISKKFQDLGASKKIADKNAERYLTQAAKIKGTEIALPKSNQTIDVQTQSRVPDVSSLLGIEVSGVGQNELQRVNELTVRLQQAGYSRRDIENIAKSCANSRVLPTNVIETYETKVEYLNNKEAQEEAKVLIEAMTGKNATSRQLKTEMQERLVLKSTFDVKSEDVLSAMRQFEQKTFKDKTQIQVAREFAKTNRGKLNNEEHMGRARKELIEKLQAGGSSMKKARKDAENIINLAAQYNNEV